MLAHHSRRSVESPIIGESSDLTPGNHRMSAPGAARSPSPLKFFSSSRSPPVEGETPENKQETARKRWTVDYLTELRKPSGARPMGARPPPGRASTISTELPPRASSTLATSRPDDLPSSRIEQLKRSISPFGGRRSYSDADARQHAGRPLAREPDIDIMEDIARANAKVDNVQVDINGRRQSMPYYERGQRWMEKQEAKSLRVAMQAMDFEEEKRVHAAAQEEAADLVWKHRYPDKPYENPDAMKHAIKDHLRQGSHARSQSIGPFETLYITGGGRKPGRRVPSDGSDSNKSDSSNSSGGSRVVSVSSKGSNDSKDDADGGKRRSSLSFINPAGRVFGRRRSSRKSRNSSGGKHFSLFSNPKDQIYEEPESVTETRTDMQKGNGVLVPKSRNISGNHSHVETQKPTSEFLNRTSFITENRLSSIDIHKNPPTQSRDPSYTRNETASTLPVDNTEEERPATKDGMEIRSDDIRAATSMRLKDRSEKLPKPTYVSDSPGRPIVSFQSDYKPSDSRPGSDGRAETRGRTSISGARPLPGIRHTPPQSSLSSAPVPSINFSSSCLEDSPAPSVPSICLPDETPIRQSNSGGPSIPMINLPGGEPASSPPAIHVNGSTAGRPAGTSRPSAAPTAQPVLRGHWSPAAPVARNGAACHSCGRAIRGRTLTAAGERFHPECFNCWACNTNLEHVAFYPEPEAARAERLSPAGYQQQHQHQHQHQQQSMPGDADARFFCHLDFHENFSPRCKSCKTPIEADVILACGAHWHQGHFFCAQCGDPFDGDKPFIEKDGWAWCVPCYKGRYSGRCRACKRPVVDDGVMALGAEWHADCFVCKECNGPFEDGRFFTRGEGHGPVCVRCEECRLKA